MKLLSEAILSFTDWVWGYPCIILLVVGGVFLTIQIHFIQFTKLGFILKNTIIKSMGEKGTDKTFSGWQAVTGALASTLGNGTIVGAGMAIGLGGPGAIFWMWLCGLVACAIKYGEVVLAMNHRILNKDGQWEGGPQHYLPSATGWKWLGGLFAVIMVFAMFLSAFAQIGAGVDNVVVLGLNRIICTIIFTFLAALVVLGGMRSLLGFTEKIVPFMSVLYIGAGLIVIGLNFRNLPDAFLSIFRYAFTGHAAFGGFGGAGAALCIRWGLARGIYSNDAGAGMTTITHSVADVNHPVQQGMWAIFEVFFSTIIVCTVSALVVLVTGVWTVSSDAATLTLAGFETSLGRIGSIIIAVCLLLFTFTSAVASIEFGVSQMRKLFGEHMDKIFRCIYLILLFVGGIVGIQALISYMDFFAFCLILLNVTGIYKCYREIRTTTEEYFDNPERWEKETWAPWVHMRENYEADR